MKIFIGVFAATAVCGLIYWFLHYQNNHIVTDTFTISTAQVRDPVKIVHLSDLHSKRFRDLPERIGQLAPDLVVITGDLINDHGKNEEKMLEFLTSMPYPKYYVTGNHERRLEHWETLMQKIRATGTHVLLDECTALQIKNTTLHILGLDENQASFDHYDARRRGNFEYKNYTDVFDEFSKQQGFRLVLSHFPENFKMIGNCSYHQYDFDLMLSGHAHGGQFILPLVGSVYAPGQGLFPKYTHGEFGDRPKLIVSRGMGNSEFPFRLFNYPEIVEIELIPQSTEKNSIK